MTYLKEVAYAQFPKPTGLNVNMMPFVMGDLSSLPAALHLYWPMIERCNVPDQELGKVGYLSITESTVAAGSSQRRPGVHTEAYGTLGWGGWGGGGKRGSGLYMASNVEASCRAWNKYVTESGHMGDCEHLLADLGDGETLRANRLYWMTDRTPHESMRLTNPANRQWFRLVTSHVTKWFSKHSTANQLGVKPSCQVDDGDKFNVAG